MKKRQLPQAPDCLCAEFIEKTGEPCLPKPACVLACHLWEPVS